MIFLIIIMPSLLFGVFLGYVGISVVDDTSTFLILSAINATILSIIYSGVK